MLLHVTDIISRGAEFVSAEAMYRGRWVHRACHLDNVRRLDAAATAASAPQWWGYVQAWQLAKKELGITILASEESFRDEVRGYVGTRDAVVVMRCRRKRQAGVVDLKCDASGSGAVPDTTGLQTAAYVGQGRLFRAACSLHQDGTYHWLDDRHNKDLFRPGDWGEFCSRLAVFHADIKRGWREAPAEREE